jgi:hypothetical protein
MKKKGLGALPDKQRREVRRRNHVAYDLGDRKYHQRVIPSRDADDDWMDEVDEYFFDKEMGLTSKE